MYELSLLFFQIAIFKKGPQDVPASAFVLRLLLLVYVAINYLILFLNGAQSTALLYFAGKTARFPQSLTAMVGTDVVISFFALPAIATLNSHANDLAYFSMLALVLWHWLVSGHIMKNALDRSLFFGLGLALLYIMLSSQIMAALFPEITSTPQ